MNSNMIDAYKFVANRDGGEKFALWKTRAEALIVTSTASMTSKDKTLHGMSILKLLSVDPTYLDIMELSSTWESALVRLQVVFGLTPEELQFNCFKLVGSYGPECESVNSAIMRLRILIKKCDEVKIPLNLELKIFLLNKVIPDGARNIISLHLESTADNGDGSVVWSTILDEICTRYGTCRLKAATTNTSSVKQRTVEPTTTLHVKEESLDVTTSKKYCAYCKREGHTEVNCWSKKKADNYAVRALVDNSPDPKQCF